MEKGGGTFLHQQGRRDWENLLQRKYSRIFGRDRGPSKGMRKGVRLMSTREATTEGEEFQ